VALPVSESIDEADGEWRRENGAAAAVGIVEAEEAETGLGTEGPFFIEFPVDGLGKAEGEGRLGGDAVPVGEAGDDPAGQREAGAAQGAVGAAEEIGAGVGFLRDFGGEAPAAEEGVVGVGGSPAVLCPLFGAEVGVAAEELGFEVRGDILGEEEKKAKGHRNSFRAGERDGWAGCCLLRLGGQGLADAVERVGQGLVEDTRVEADLIEGGGLHQARQAVNRSPGE
jgi:hypothetical protein